MSFIMNRLIYRSFWKKLRKPKKSFERDVGYAGAPPTPLKLSFSGKIEIIGSKNTNDN
jgi:hypothetical protein